VEGRRQIGQAWNEQDVLVLQSPINAVPGTIRISADARSPIRIASHRGRDEPARLVLTQEFAEDILPGSAVAVASRARTTIRQSNDAAPSWCTAGAFTVLSPARQVSNQ
jgi:hypothetical protein